MRRNFIISILLFLIINILGITVKAEINVADNNRYMIEKLANISSPKITSVSSNNDLVTVKSTGSVVGYYYGVTPKLNDAKYTPTSSNTFYASVKNGQYYFWVSGSGVTGGNVSPVMFASAVKVSTSCQNQRVDNCTGSGVMERCFIYKGGKSVSIEIPGDLVIPAEGYKLTKFKSNSDNCANLSLVIGDQKLAQRYCRITFEYTCEKDVPECTGCSCNNSCPTIPYLTGLSVSSGVLSPAFNSGTYNYKVAVDGEVATIDINAVGSTGNAAGTIEGTGTKQLSFGTQTFKVVISNNAGKSEYTIEVVKEQAKSKDNTLKSLGVSVGTLTPEFNPATTTYNVEVESDVETVDITAELNDEKASFTEGYGPRTVSLSEGTNQIQLRVVSESGKINRYNVVINKKGVDVCATEMESRALLSSVEFVHSDENVVIPQLSEFSPETLYYSGIELPNEAKGFTIETSTVNYGDTVEIPDFDKKEFVPGVPEPVIIRVTDRDCPSITKEYTFEITIKKANPESTDATLAKLEVQGHDIGFSKEKNNYNIRLKKNETSVKVSYLPTSSGALCHDNNLDSDNKPKRLAVNSEIVITCVSEDGAHTITYTIKVSGIDKGVNTFLIIILVIAIILVLIYLVLRLLGYKIIINGEVIGNFFRGIGEKIRNLFDK